MTQPLPAHDALAEAILVAHHVDAAPVALDPADLMSEPLALVWRTADTLPRPIDAGALALALNDSGRPRPAHGWPAFLTTLTTEAPAVADLAPVVARVQTLAHQRRLASELARLAVEAREPQAPEWPETALARLTELAPRPVSRVAVVQGAALAAPVPPVPWVCEALHWAPGRPTMLSGYGGAGKTMLACAAALAVAAGQGRLWDVADLQRTGPVRHLNWEMHEDSLRHRYQRLARGMGVDLAASELGICNRRELAGLTLTSPTAVRDLTLLLDGCTLALFDSFRAATPGVEENDSGIRIYLDNLLEVAERTGCMMLVIHHFGKTPSDAGSDVTQRLRGSSGIHDAIDTNWSVIPGPGGLRVTQTKVSRSSKANDLEVQIVDNPDGGLTVTHMPPEQLAAIARQSSPARECELSIIKALRDHGPQTGYVLENGTALGITGNRALRRTCLRQMLADGLVSEQGAGPSRKVVPA